LQVANQRRKESVRLKVTREKTTRYGVGQTRDSSISFPKRLAHQHSASNAKISLAQHLVPILSSTSNLTCQLTRSLDHGSVALGPDTGKVHILVGKDLMRFSTHTSIARSRHSAEYRSQRSSHRRLFCHIENLDFLHHGYYWVERWFWSRAGRANLRRRSPVSSFSAQAGQ
jgi:hypothetical protein